MASSKVLYFEESGCVCIHLNQYFVKRKINTSADSNSCFDNYSKNCKLWDCERLRVNETHKHIHDKVKEEYRLIWFCDQINKINKNTKIGKMCIFSWFMHWCDEQNAKRRSFNLLFICLWILCKSYSYSHSHKMIQHYLNELNDNKTKEEDNSQSKTQVIVMMRFFILSFILPDLYIKDFCFVCYSLFDIVIRLPYFIFALTYDLIEKEKHLE